MPALYTANELLYLERMFDAAVVEIADIETLLRTRFGLTEFRPGQRAAPLRRAAAAVRRPRTLQQRAFSGGFASDTHRPVRRGRGALHLGVGPQLPPGLSQAGRN